DAEQLAVPRLVNGLDPADRLVLHDGTGVRDPREHARRDVVAVLLTRLGLGEADAGDLRIRVDRTRDGAVVDHRLVTHRVLRRDLPLAERGVRELPVAGAVADGVEVRDVGPAVLVGRDALAAVVLDAGLLEADSLDLRTPSDR